MAGSRDKRLRGLLVGLTATFSLHILSLLIIILVVFATAGFNGSAIGLLYLFSLFLLYTWSMYGWLWQFLYIVPIVLWAYSRGYRWTINGIALGIAASPIIGVLVRKYLVHLGVGQ